MKKNIAVIAGGDSSEIIVSLKSAAGIYSFLDKEKYNPYIVIITSQAWEVQISEDEKVPVDKNNFSFELNGKKIQFDFAYITIHGTPGENGILQGYFELIGLPYSGCDVLVSSTTFNKFMCNQLLKAFGVKVAEAVLLRKGQSMTSDDVAVKIGFPCFVKPNTGGSSFGVTKVKTAGQVQSALEKAFSEADEVLIEAFMDGMEVTCGMYKTREKEIVFPVTEVVSDNEFFDYDAKYKGKSQEITPARISKELTERIQKLTKAIYEILGCKGLTRTDYIITENSKIHLLEINTTPGMTVASFIPQQVRAAGLNMTIVMSEIIEDAFIDE
jgi:D-alanine-D-alanine ligase